MACVTPELAGTDPKLVKVKLITLTNGTSYHSDTSDDVIRILETSRSGGFKIRMFYGDVGTGISWMEEYDTIGRLSRSYGPLKIPILVKTRKSTGGGAILDNCIVAIQWMGNAGPVWKYRHPTFKVPQLQLKKAPCPVENLPWEVYNLNKKEVHARFTTELQGLRFLHFIRGKTWGKGGRVALT